VKEVVDALTAIKKSMAQLVDEFGSQHSKSHFSHRNQDASEDEGRLLISREVPCQLCSASVWLRLPPLLTRSSRTHPVQR